MPSKFEQCIQRSKVRQVLRLLRSVRCDNFRVIGIGNVRLNINPGRPRKHA